MRSLGNPAEVSAEIGRLVEARRKSLDITQAEAALLAGCSELFVGSVENGKPTVRLDKLVALLDALGLEIGIRSRGA